MSRLLLSAKLALLSTLPIVAHAIPLTLNPVSVLKVSPRDTTYKEHQCGINTQIQGTEGDWTMQVQVWGDNIARSLQYFPIANGWQQETSISKYLTANDLQYGIEILYSEGPNGGKTCGPWTFTYANDGPMTSGGEGGGPVGSCDPTGITYFTCWYGDGFVE